MARTRLQKLFERYAEMPPQKKRIIAFTVVFSMVLLLFYMLYMGKHSQKQTASRETRKSEMQALMPESSKMLKESLYYQTQLKTKRLEKEIEELKKEILAKQKEEQKKKEEEKKQLLEQIKQLK